MAKVALNLTKPQSESDAVYKWPMRWLAGWLTLTAPLVGEQGGRGAEEAEERVSE